MGVVHPYPDAMLVAVRLAGQNIDHVVLGDRAGRLPVSFDKADHGAGLRGYVYAGDLVDLELGHDVALTLRHHSSSGASTSVSTIRRPPMLNPVSSPVLNLASMSASALTAIKSPV